MPKPTTLAEWQSMFEGIYGKQNESASYMDIWLHLIEEAGEVAEDCRKENFRRLDVDLPDVFAWLCAFSNKYSVALDDLVWDKFPAVCPYCLREERCICIAEAYPDYDPGRLRDFRKKNKNKPQTIEQWQALFGKIYGNVNRVVSRFGVGFHLMEEVSEVAKEIRLDRREDCKAELADVFAWIVALVMKVQADFEQFSFSDALWQAYPGICKECKKEECECTVRPTLRGSKE